MTLATQLLSLLGIGLAVLVAAELACRHLGLHRPLIYERTGYGYRIRPGQELRFFGRRVSINAQGLRSGPISDAPADGVVRLLALGDSITNGGVATPQEMTYPVLLQAELAHAGVRGEVLNASAGGWALENELGWLEANGLYGSLFVVHQVATHDLHQRLSPSSLVDTHPSFPSRLPRLGLEYVIKRRILPHLRRHMQLVDPGVYQIDRLPEDIDRAFRVLDRVRDRVEAAGARLVILHVEQPAPFEPDDALTLDAKARLVAWCRARGTLLVQPAARIEAAGGRRLFMDPIHPSPEGNAVLASAVSEALLTLLRPTPR